MPAHYWIQLAITALFFAIGFFFGLREFPESPWLVTFGSLIIAVGIVWLWKHVLRLHRENRVDDNEDPLVRYLEPRKPNVEEQIRRYDGH